MFVIASWSAFIAGGICMRDRNVALLQRLTEHDPRGNCGKFLFCALRGFPVSTKLLYRPPHVLIRLFELHGSSRVRISLDKNVCENAVCVQRFLEHGAK